MLAVENITKKFPGVTALDNVSMELHAGKVNAIIGENGAGKSTLMKILSGVYADFEGRIVLKNEAVSFSNPKEAQEKGITIIHQELNLVPHLSITENIFLGREIIDKWGLLDRKAMRRKARSLLDRLKVTVSADSRVSGLKVGQQQLVEIAKALLVESDVIIMDEPTSAITDSEVKVLFEIIEDLRKENKAIVYISHKLDELFKMADRYIVLRDGKMIECGDMQGMTHDLLISKMVGRQISMMRKSAVQAQPPAVLEIKDLCLKHPVRKKEDFLKNITFTVGNGEVLGIFGLMGAGRTELLETIFGLHPSLSTGTIKVDGEFVRCKTPASAICAGLALVPEDRKKDGLVLGLDVKTNICITTLRDLENGIILNERKETALGNKYIGELQIKTASCRQAAKNLSGGNQQKIVLAKWLATKPKVLMLDEPTRGIDIHAKNEIYKLILALAAEGMGIIVVSSEMPEILAIADRIIVMAEGCVTAEMAVSDASEDRILKAAIPKTN